MSEFVKTLLSLSVSGTLLLLLILGLRPLYKNRFSRRWQYYIWIVAALRFLLPFAPDTTLVGSLFEGFQAAEAAGEERPVLTESPFLLVDSNETGGAEAGPKGNYAPAGAAPANPASASDEPHLPDSFTCLFYVWAVTAPALFIRRILIYRGFLRFLRAGNIEVSDPGAQKLLSDCREKLGVKTRVALYRNALIHSPITTGFFRPSIILPEEGPGEKALCYVFAHELQHCKQRDMLYKWLIQLVVCVHWFNPLVYLLVKEVNRACELSCDETVISALDEQGRREYGDTLLLFSGAGNSFKNTLASVTLTEGAEQLKERLGAIMSFKKKTKYIAAASLAAALALSAGGYAVGAYAGQPDSADPSGASGAIDASGASEPNDPTNASGATDPSNASGATDPSKATGTVDASEAVDPSGGSGTSDPTASVNGGEPSGNTEPLSSNPKENETEGEDRVYMPQWMQPYSVILFDENLNYTVVQGGELTPEEIAKSDEIAVIGYEDHSEDMLAEPYTKVDYDLHGFIQNVYYRVPGTADQYQLSNPAWDMYLFIGSWYDDMGSELVVTRNDDGSCGVDFGIYKLAYMWDARIVYDVNTGIFSFAGTDVMGNVLAVELTWKGEDKMTATLTASAYSSCPPGTEFEFTRDKS